MFYRHHLDYPRSETSEGIGILNDNSMLCVEQHLLFIM